MRKSTKQFLTYGLPFLSFMVVGALGLSQLQKPKIQAVDARRRRDAANPQARKFDLDDEYQKLQQTMADNQWSNVRIKRPPGFE